MSDEDLAELERAVDIACQLRSPRPPLEADAETEVWNSSVPDYFFSSDGALVVSFDQKWEPFLANTRAYNRGDLKWYIPSGGEVLYALGQAFEALWLDDEIRGGRTFLNAYGAWRRPGGANAPAEWLIAWSIPRASPLLGVATMVSVWPPHSSMLTDA